MRDRLSAGLVAALATFVGLVLLTLALRISQECRVWGYSLVECFWRFFDP